MSTNMQISFDIALSPPAGDWPADGYSVEQTSGLLADARGTTVLIVEDEALVALDIEQILGAAGFTILATVDTEREAIDAAGQLKPDAILMDIALRQGNGISAARAIAAFGPACIIFLSGNSDPSTLAAVASLDSAGFIHKPYQSGQLPLQVAQALDKSRSR